MLLANCHIFTLTTATRKVAVALLLATLTSIFLRAQVRDMYTRINVLFPVNRAVLLRDYANNEQALATLDRYLDETSPADIRLVA